MVQEFNAKLSDFGLAKAGPTQSQTHVTTRVMGTEGYCDPRYIATGNLFINLLEKKMDIYNMTLDDMIIQDTTQLIDGYNLLIVCHD